MRQRHTRATPVVVVIVALLVLSDEVVAGTFATLQDNIRANADRWLAVAQDAGTWLFYRLLFIGWVLTGLHALLKKASLAEFVGETMLMLMSALFFLVLLQNGTWIGTITTALTQVGATMGGLSDLSIGTVAHQGSKLINALLNGVAETRLNILAALVGLVAAVMVGVGYVGVLSAMLTMTIIIYVATYAGLLMLAFGALSYTRSLAVDYLFGVIKIGLQAMILYLVIGVGASIGTTWIAAFPQPPPGFWDNVGFTVGQALPTWAGGVPAPALGDFISVGMSAIIFGIMAWGVPWITVSALTGSHGGASSFFGQLGAMTSLGGTIAGAVFSGMQAASRFSTINQNVQALKAAANVPSPPGGGPRAPSSIGPGSPSSASSRGAPEPPPTTLSGRLKGKF